MTLHFELLTALEFKLTDIQFLIIENTTACNVTILDEIDTRVQVVVTGVGCWLVRYCAIF